MSIKFKDIQALAPDGELLVLVGDDGKNYQIYANESDGVLRVRPSVSQNKPALYVVEDRSVLEEYSWEQSRVQGNINTVFATVDLTPEQQTAVREMEPGAFRLLNNWIYVKRLS